MPLSLVFILHPRDDHTLPYTIGYAVHSCLFDLIRRLYPALADELHTFKEKPFTLSPLQGEFDSVKGGLVVRGGREYWFRLTSLSGVLSQVFLELSEKVQSLRILGCIFDVIRVAGSEEEHPWAGKIGFDELYERWFSSEERLTSKVRMRFFSPTTFRSSGRNIPFPLPRLVFQSILNKWNRYAYIHPSSELGRVIEDGMTLSRYELRTKMMDFGKYREVGFIGESEFMVMKGIEIKLIRWVHLLSDFAFFSGVGYKTTMGMGQVRKITSNPPFLSSCY